MLIGQDGVPKDLIEEREIRDGVIREVQVGVIMDINTAKEAVRWLQDKINIIEGAKKITK